MHRFIPFEDDWDALARISPSDLVPYRVGMSIDTMHSSQDAQQEHDLASDREVLSAIANSPV